MHNYYCGVDGIWRRTPCIHEGCARRNYDQPKDEIVKKMQEAMRAAGNGGS